VFHKLDDASHYLSRRASQRFNQLALADRNPAIVVAVHPSDQLDEDRPRMD